MGENGVAKTYMRFTTVTGYFLQDDPETPAGNFSYTTTDFGLKNRSYVSDGDRTTHPATQWQRFENEVTRLNTQSPSSVQYKVLFLARHGQGVHNVAEAFYGTPAWDCHWSKLEGNGTVNWVDAQLTDLGLEQARQAGHFWAKEMAEQKIPMPQSYYSSPLDRCLATARATFSTLDLPPDRPFRPIVKELLREVTGIHTCDRRSPKSHLQQKYPEFAFEAHFPENDEAWDPDTRESDSAVDARLKRLLDDIFTHDVHSTFVSLSSHSGAISAVLRVVGHREFRLVTGSVIPVLVRAEVVGGEEPVREIEPPGIAPSCM